MVKKCRAPKPVGVKAHTSSAVPVKTHCRGARGGAKKKPLIMSFEGGGRVRDASGKVVKRAARKPKVETLMSFEAGGRVRGAGGKIVKRAKRADAGVKRKAACPKCPKKKKAPPVPARPSAGSVARAREWAAAKKQPRFSYA